jgi:hypothetical protein
VPRGWAVPGRVSGHRCDGVPAATFGDVHGPVPGGAWHGPWHGTPDIPAPSAPSVRFPVSSVQPARSVHDAVVMVRRRSTVRFRNEAPGQSNDSKKFETRKTVRWGLTVRGMGRSRVSRGQFSEAISAGLRGASPRATMQLRTWPLARKANLDGTGVTTLVTGQNYPEGVPGRAIGTTRSSASSGSGMPFQDVGKALGVSFQRAKQLIDEADKLAGRHPASAPAPIPDIDLARCADRPHPARAADRDIDVGGVPVFLLRRVNDQRHESVGAVREGGHGDSEERQ